MIRETFEPCPSCGYPYAHYYHDTEYKSPDEMYCLDCGFEWQASRGNLSPDDEATAHRGLREETIMSILETFEPSVFSRDEVYQDLEDEWWRDEDNRREESQIREIEEEK